jgi:hypothetical protein
MQGNPSLFYPKLLPASSHCLTNLYKTLSISSIPSILTLSISSIPSILTLSISSIPSILF